MTGTNFDTCEETLACTIAECRLRTMIKTHDPQFLDELFALCDKSDWLRALEILKLSGNQTRLTAVERLRKFLSAPIGATLDPRFSAALELVYSIYFDGLINDIELEETLAALKVRINSATASKGDYVG